MYRQWVKNLLNSIISSTCPDNMANFGQLAAEIVSGVSGTPANFNRFRVLASLLQRRCSTEANQTLQDVWPSPASVHYIYIFGALPPDGILPGAKFTACKSCIFLYWQPYCRALEQWASAKLCSVEQRAPPAFGRTTITLGIGPHSSMHGSEPHLICGSLGHNCDRLTERPSYCLAVMLILVLVLMDS